MSSSSPAASDVPGSAPAPQVVEDCLGIVQLLSDGTVRRSADYSALPRKGGVPSGLPVQWKDVVYDATHALRLRMYRPTGGQDGATIGGGKKLPVLVYFHGGGFCIASFELPNFHAGALRLTAELPALVLSTDYRLAPEHRLPAAHDDAEAVFSWLRAQAASAAADPWLAESADFDRVFVCGDSAGGNISHHIAVRHGSGQLALDPLRLAGCVMLWPYFGGEERMPSEAACPANYVMGTALFDQMWRLALPAGATRDHPAANPFGPGSVPLDTVNAFPPVLIVDPEHDALHDRVADYVARLKAAGKPLELVVFAGQGHGFFVMDPCGEASDELIRVIRRFVHGG
ncbi:carboxylesterase 15-like [Phragmites australis]|uniref:carboxylesterase 15-like n=1 Tax=Phragmites australis TaxID=29695 RepID=UPI002D787AE0|nr:carboxylesterase 15-like [Phragmites australis]